jgi:hypothetical protein
MNLISARSISLESTFNPHNNRVLVTHLMGGGRGVNSIASFCEVNFQLLISDGFPSFQQNEAERKSWFPLKVVTNEKLGGSGSCLVFEDGFGPWRLMSVHF